MLLNFLKFLRCPACKSELSIIIFEIDDKCEKLPDHLFFKELKMEEIKREIGNREKIMENINIKSGILLCNSCKRWYPIGSSIEGVPELLYPDDLRDVWRDKKFIRKWSEKIPETLKQNFNLLDKS